MSTWPANLPAPNQTGYGGEQRKAFTATVMVAGNTRYRKTTSTDIHSINLTFRFNASQMLAFRTFWLDEINLGSDWFEIALNLGNGILTYAVHAAEAYKYTALPGNNWEVTFPVEVRAWVT